MAGSPLNVAAMKRLERISILRQMSQLAAEKSRHGLLGRHALNERIEDLENKFDGLLTTKNRRKKPMRTVLQRKVEGEGAVARAEGHPSSSNPYCGAGRLHAYWAHGWDTENKARKAGRL